MKRINMLWITIALTMVMSSCLEPGYKQFDDKKLVVYPDAKSVLGISANQGTNFEDLRLVVVHSLPGRGAPGEETNSYWAQSHTDIIDKMESGWEKSGYDKSLYTEYTSLTELSIVADKVLFGREAGSELVDKFVMKTDSPLFGFPDGEILYNCGIQTTFAEWTESRIMTPEQFTLILDDTPTETYNEITFTITEKGENSWRNGEFSRTSSCTLEI